MIFGACLVIIVKYAVLISVPVLYIDIDHNVDHAFEANSSTPNEKKKQDGHGTVGV